LPEKTIVHTAASVSKDILSRAGEHFGVLYPLQSLKKESNHLPDIPFIIDASDENTMKELEALAHSISDKVIEAGDDTRKKLHLAAVFCNNFVNHIYTLAENYCRSENIDFKLMIPLIKETALRIEEIAPKHAQTGPALRHDLTTIEQHKALLANYPDMLRIYDLFTKSIYNSR
jgi:predicted short-subunit dehydrogenase-like oxidoreductase (DUF2520 family)